MRSLSILYPIIIIILLAGCGAPVGPSQSSGIVYREETVTLPTAIPIAEPSPVNTRVMPAPVFTPVPTMPITPTLTPIPDETRALVIEVIDGDTIAVVMEGDPPGRSYTVRYIGIDAPPNIPEDPWGKVAYETNRKKTNLKIVRLVRDETNFDDEGNLLRYVYVGDEMMSIIMVEQGLARADLVEPNTRFQAEILEAENRAQSGRLGLWGLVPSATSTPSNPTIEPTEAPVTTTPNQTDTAEPETATPSSDQSSPENTPSSPGPSETTSPDETSPENNDPLQGPP